ncbi:MAG: hypothetical protein NC924_06455, partial [Candidatus Omnitrophica bacterium]|nr:hypothetical protein [Candidatus Omnitrophota bacterium]
EFGGEDAPVVSTSQSTGSVVVNVAAANPSATRAQTTKVKVYLPQEITPKDIIDLGGLELEFDSAKSLYYAYKNDIELAPKEVRSYKVEMEDIWIIPQTNVEIMKLRTGKLAEALSGTEYAETCGRLAEQIYRFLDEVAKQQADITLSREQHIGAYRANLQKMEAFKQQLTDMEKLIVKKPDDVGALTREMTFKVIMIVVIFIGLLSAIFFLTWSRQAALRKNDPINQAKQFSFPEEPKEPEKDK